jgi:hypothetical protein
MQKPVLVELTRREIDLILVGMTGSQYPIAEQQDAFNLVLKLRDKLREAA